MTRFEGRWCGASLTSSTGGRGKREGVNVVLLAVISSGNQVGSTINHQTDASTDHHVPAFPPSFHYYYHHFSGSRFMKRKTKWFHMGIRDTIVCKWGLIEQ